MSNPASHSLANGVSSPFAEVAKVGSTLAALLDSPACPPSIRTAIVNHLSELYEKTDLMRPDIVRTVYSLVANNGEPAVTEMMGYRQAAPVPPEPQPLQAAVAPTQQQAMPPQQPVPPGNDLRQGNPFLAKTVAHPLGGSIHISGPQ